MGKATKYFLVGRDRETNEFDVIRVDGKRFTTLEDIDLYTTSFNNASDLSKSLNREGDIDYFIVSQSKRGQEVFINKNEVLFSNRTKIRKIAEDSKIKNIGRSEYEIMEIISKFCQKMSHDSNYHRLVRTGRTNIYPKFVSYFYLSKYHTANEIRHKDGGWITKSYPLARNIVDSFINDHTSNKHLSDLMYRDLLDKRIRSVTDKDYDENQMTLFDLFPEERKDNTDTLLEVMTTIDSITIDETEDKSFVETIPESVRDNIVRLTRNKYYYETAPDVFTDEYHKKVVQAQTSLISQLSDAETLDSTHNWCMMYNKYKENISGDVNGFSYTKTNN